MARNQVYWEDVSEGMELPTGFEIPINWTTVAKQVSGSQDFYEVHHNPDFARSGGHADIFMNTGFMRAATARIITDWISDDGWLRKLRMEMRRMNRPGDIMRVRGRVTRKYVEAGEHMVECNVWAENDREGVTTPCKAWVALPSRERNQELLTKEQDFHQGMLDIYRRAKEESGYRATRFLQMVRRRGGMEAAKRILRSKRPQQGFAELSQDGRPDLTVEQLVLKPEFQELFSQEELQRAKERLAGGQGQS